MFFFLMAVIAVEGWPTYVPVYSLIITIAVSATYVVPGGLVFAIMGQVVTQSHANMACRFTSQPSM